MKNLNTIKKAEVKEMMKALIRADEKIIDVEIAEHAIWVLVKRNGLIWNYSIMKESGRVYKNLVDRLEGKRYHYCDKVD